jgi:pimeloyl-ACP methyl ester carboxylesterase
MIAAAGNSPRERTDHDLARQQARHRERVNLHYIVAGKGPVVLGMHGWPQNHREFLRSSTNFASQYKFIAPDLRGYADSDKPFSGYEPKTIARICWSFSRPKASMSTTSES